MRGELLWDKETALVTLPFAKHLEPRVKPAAAHCTWSHCYHVLSKGIELPVHPLGFSGEVYFGLVLTLPSTAEFFALHGFAIGYAALKQEACKRVRHIYRPSIYSGITCLIASRTILLVSGSGTLGVCLRFFLRS